MNNDLISRKALLDRLANNMEWGRNISKFSWTLAVQIKHNIVRVINELPAVDAEPPKHGKWIKDRSRDMLRCSACQDFFVDMWLYWYKYCPNCGARMDGE